MWVFVAELFAAYRWPVPLGTLLPLGTFQLGVGGGAEFVLPSVPSHAELFQRSQPRFSWRRPSPSRQATTSLSLTRQFHWE